MCVLYDTVFQAFSSSGTLRISVSSSNALSVLITINSTDPERIALICPTHRKLIKNKKKNVVICHKIGLKERRDSEKQGSQGKT